MYPTEAWHREERDRNTAVVQKAIAQQYETGFGRCELFDRRRVFGVPTACANWAALDAWTALWFWPSSKHAADAPNPATFGGYLAAAFSGDVHDPQVAISRAIAASRRFFHWPLAFPGVFSRANSGFDAMLGNPPWVAYAGRAAQPIASEVFNFYLAHSPAFRGYRTLHGLFVHKCASLLRVGGRLGLVVPTSISDLRGYEATRAAHDAIAQVDGDLPDFGADAFDDVFQPAMALLSTRRATRRDVPTTPPTGRPPRGHLRGRTSIPSVVGSLTVWLQPQRCLLRYSVNAVSRQARPTVYTSADWIARNHHTRHQSARAPTLANLSRAHLAITST